MDAMQSIAGLAKGAIYMLKVQMHYKAKKKQSGSLCPRSQSVFS